MLPGAGSAAIDAADCSLSSAQDQRGANRPASLCDKGAVEVGATVTVQVFTAYNTGPISEGSSVTNGAIAYGPASASLDYEFDCDNNGGYETQGSGAGPNGTASCTFNDDGTFNVGVRVCDAADAGNCATDTTTVTVNNIAPTVNTPIVNPSPSDEGQSVVASATFTDPGTLDPHTCTVDYGDGDGPVEGTMTQGSGNGTCTGPEYTYADDDPSGTAGDDYTVTVVVTDNDGDSGSNSVDHFVTNVDPVIDSITTNGPVPQGQPVTITVDATDVGINDTLTYGFDCDNNGSYEIGPQPGNSTDCTLDPAAATSTIGVRVEDDDLGVVTDTVDVSQTVTLCLNYLTGAVGAAGAGGCTAGTIALTVPGPSSTTFCISSYTGGLRWSPGGTCTAGERPHVVPDSGPLHYCESLWTRQMRVTWTPGQCPAYEIPGVIPG